MRTTADINATQFEKSMRAAYQAGEAGDKRQEAAILRSVLELLTGIVEVRWGDAPAAALHARLQECNATLSETILDVCLEIARATLGYSVTDAVGWIDFVTEALGRPSPDDSPWTRRLHGNLTAARAIIGVQIGDEGLARPAPDAIRPGDPQRGGATVQRLAIALNHARRLATEGEAAAVTHIHEHLAQLDPMAPMADEIGALARLLVDELSSREPLERRLACRGAMDISIQRSGHETVTMLLRCAGYAQDAQNDELATSDLLEALAACERPDARELRWLVMLRLGFIAARSGRTEEAIAYFKFAVRAQLNFCLNLARQSPERAQLSQSGGIALDQLRDLLIAEGRLDEAEETARLRLARDATCAAPPTLRRAEVTLEAVIGEAAAKRLSINDAILVWRRRNSMADAPPELETKPPPSGVANLVFLGRAGTLACLVATAEGIRVIDLGLPMEAAYALAFEVRSAVTARCALDAAILHKAFAELLEPVLIYVGAARTLRIGAPAGLRGLPWAALHDGNAPLIDRFVIERLTAPPKRPSAGPPAAVVLTAFAASQAAPGFPALGQPVIDETQEVASLAVHGHAIVGSRFNEAAVAAALRGANLVHFATHLVADVADPTASCLLLGDGAWLSLERLVELAGPGIDLMILSACTSAVGGSDDGSGIDDLILTSGVAAVCGTLWSVDSGAMAMLIPAMVRDLRAGRRKSEALANAQRAMLLGEIGGGRYSLPYFYAGVVIGGDMSPWPPGAFDI